MAETYKRIYFGFILLLFTLTTLYLFRVPVLQLAGRFLIEEDKPEKVKYAFVLSGDGYNRGRKAAELYQAGYVKKMVCTGENSYRHLSDLLGIEIVESELTKLNMLKVGVDSNAIEIIQKGTSTREEAEAILEYCLKRNIDTAMIISSRFHTRRIDYVFRKKFIEEDIHLLIIGAGNNQYNEKFWWRSEEGLIHCNNEFLKLLYYWYKY